MTIAEFLNGQAEKKGLTRYQIAEITGFTRTQIKRIFDGEQMPKVDTFTVICKAMEVSETDISNFIKAYYKNTKL